MVYLTGPAVLDLNTQYDLFAPDGAYALREASTILPALEKLFTWIEDSSLPVVSTRLHGVFMPDPHFHTAICLAGTPGYRKLDFTLLSRRAELPMDCGTDLPVDAFQTSRLVESPSSAPRQYIFDLPDANPFNSPRLDRLLSETEAAVWLIAGGPLESTVRMAVMGLIQRRQKVAMVKDALGRRDLYEGEMAYRQIESKNVEWLDVREIINRYTPRRLRCVGAAALGRSPLRRMGRRLGQALRMAGAAPRLAKYRSHTQHIAGRRSAPTRRPRVAQAARLLRLRAGRDRASGGGRFRWPR